MDCDVTDEACVFRSIEIADRVREATGERGDAEVVSLPATAMILAYAELLDRESRLDEAELERRFRSRAMEYAWENPSYVLEVGCWNTLRLLGLQGSALEHQAAPESGIGNRTSDIDVYAFYLLAVGALASLIAGAARRTPGFVWALPIFLALSLVFVISYMRYRLPIDPFLILLVAAGLVRLATAMQELRPWISSSGRGRDPGTTRSS